MKKYLLLLLLLPLAFSQCKKDDDTEINNPPPTDTIPNPPVDINPLPTEPATQTTPWPQWIFYHWVWEDESTQQSATQLIDDYLAHDIPVGAIIIDSPWETDYTTFVWDTSRFASPQAMIDYFHSLKVRVFMWQVSAINLTEDSLYNYAKQHDYFMKTSASDTDPAIVDWWKGDGSLIDLFNPDAVAWWKSLMDSTLNFGIDGWKTDGTDYYALSADYSPYLDAEVDRLEYSHAYYRLFFDYTRQQLGNNRVITARPIDNYGIASIGGDVVAFAPKDINFCGWVGDQDGDFDGLKAALNNMYHSAAYGYPAFGSDIGGYRDDNNFPNGRSKEVFIRWAQLGALCPIMENGGGGEHRPWQFDDETTDIYRSFVNLHHALVPYLMEGMQLAYNSGTSIMSFDNETDYRYMLGTEIFVMPILTDVTQLTVDFPAGDDWVYAFDTDLVYTGGQSATVDVPLSQYPVYIRQGSHLLVSVDWGTF